MAAPDTAVTATSAGVSHKGVVLLAGVVGEGTVSCPSIHELDRAVVRIIQWSTIHDYVLE